jgi:BNR/Asp-box repeat
VHLIVFGGPKRRLVLVLAVAGAAIGAAAALAASSLVRISNDPFTNSTSQHKTQVEPDTFAFGSTIVAAFQSGRFFDGGSSDIGFATSTDGGATWTHGFLPSLTQFATPPGPYGRASDPSVAYDPKHDVWLISTLDFDPGDDVTVSRSTDGGLTWRSPVLVHTGGGVDKNWVVCDTWPASPFYGNCYSEWDNNGQGNLIEMSTSTDGGKTWSPEAAPADNPSGLGGVPVVAPDGRVVVPYSQNFGPIRYFTSADGGASWSATQLVSSVSDHTQAGGLRSGPLPSAEVDKRGTVYVVWADCRFRSGCSSDDIVMAKIKPGGGVSGVVRIPIDPVTSTVDHFIPGLAVDPATGGKGAHLGLAYYYYPVSSCSQSTCELDVGFVSSTDGGATWSAAQQLAGPMNLTWLASTNQGRMVGDYISSSFANGKVFPAVAVAKAPTTLFHEAMYSSTGLVAEPGVAAATGDGAIPGATSDHPARTGKVTAN